MVNFYGSLESQRVPEWGDAYCDYKQLKKDLEHVKKSSHGSDQQSQSDGHSFKHIRMPSFQHLRTLTRRMSKRLVNFNLSVKVHLQQPNASSGYKHELELYETELLMPFGDIEGDKIFFARLDGQLNKVNKFYKDKEQEYLDVGEKIKDQLIKLEKIKKALIDKQDPMNQDGEDADSSTSYIIRENGSENAYELEERNDAVIVNIDQSNVPISKDASDIGKVSKVKLGTDSEMTSNILFGLNVPRATPTLALASVAQKIVDDVSNHMKTNDATSRSNPTRLDRKRLQYAEKMLRDACMELYRGLNLLKSFSTLNFTAFSKILKKYDKTSGRDASTSYMKVVDKAYFHSSDKALRLMEELEKSFVKLFANGDRKKGMAILKAFRQPASHKVTFFLGLFTGFSLSCLIAFFLLLDAKWFRKNEMLNEEKDLYLTAMFPLFSILFLMIIHLAMFGWNLYTWREKKINYSFIFGFNPNVEIRYRELLLIVSCLSAITTGVLLGHFVIYADRTSSFLTVIMPLSVLLAFVILLVCPLNICYRPTRMFLLSCFWRTVLAPFYKVVMADFFLADQLTSQVFMFRNIEYVLCYSLVGHFKEENIASCSGDSVKYQVIAYIVSLLPYWWRFLQCVRRWIDERDKSHITNGVKYISAFVASGASLTYSFNKTTLWMWVFILASTWATGISLYWDLCIDWGLLNWNSKNYLLRDQLILKNKNIYFASMVLNVVLRFAWMQSVTQLVFFNLDRHLIDLFFASLEVVRRGHWNFYRLENEHLNNVGKFRATKAIPLPFVDDN